jgi:hypothetical protein
MVANMLCQLLTGAAEFWGTYYNNNGYAKRNLANKSESPRKMYAPLSKLYAPVSMAIDTRE